MFQWKPDRVEVAVVDAAVDHVDALEPVRGAHVHHVVVDDEVAALHELGTELAGREHVLEVRGVVRPGREHDDARPRAARRRDRAQRREQDRAVVVDAPHRVRAEHARQDARGRGAVLEHVRDAARVAHVVLEHAVRALGVAHEVDAGDEAARAMGDVDAHGLADEAVGRRHHVAGDHAVADRGLLARVHVVEELVERADPLREPGLHHGPLVGRDDPGEQVHREGALEAVLVAAQGEGDALGAERGVAQAGPAGQFVVAEQLDVADRAAGSASRGSPGAANASSKKPSGSYPANTAVVGDSALHGGSLPRPFAPISVVNMTIVFPAARAGGGVRSPACPTSRTREASSSRPSVTSSTSRPRCRPPRRLRRARQDRHRGVLPRLADGAQLGRLALRADRERPRSFAAARPGPEEPRDRQRRLNRAGHRSASPASSTCSRRTRAATRCCSRVSGCCRRVRGVRR